MARDNPTRGYRRIHGELAGRAHRPAEVTGIRVVRRDRLGGLIHEYAQVA
jgi:hypothetical protein